MMGCGFGEGEQGYNVGRNAGLLAGIDHHVPATTVNRFCASSLQTLRMAFHAIKAGEGDTYIAPGVEAVSRAGGGAKFEFHPQLDGSEGSLYNVYIPMGMTAENVAERCSVSREAQDEWAVDVAEPRRRRPEPATSTARSSRSRRRRTETDKEGNEVGRGRHGGEGRRPAPGHDAGEAVALPPAFKEDGTVTAGNACPLNDGAAAVLVMSEERAKELGLKPQARIVASAVAAIRPEIMGLGPIPAVRASSSRRG